MHNKSHTEEALAKMRAARANQPRKWGHLPEAEIVDRLLTTDATVRRLAAEFGCSDSTIKSILRRLSTPEQRQAAKSRKQAASLRGYNHSAEFREKTSARLLGEKNPFYGRRHTEEFKRQQADRKRGLRASFEQRVAISARMQGIPIKEWTGFASTANELARRTPRYAAWRKAVYERDDYTCRMCGKRGGKMHPHHIKKFSTHPNLRYEVSNGVTLCASPCHLRTMGKEEKFEHLFEQ